RLFFRHKADFPSLRMLLTIRKQLRSHPALIPLFFFIGGGTTMSLLYLARLGLRNPDVSWDRKNNPEPWNKLSPNYQYKFFTVNMDYSKLKKDRPDF
uniref:Cytochrome c oxidase subunit NDUFA4 n=2 Tax=Cyprinodon variegatus TaxID=28743 RepID=A0A3Q2DK13_CYPVA